MHVLIRYCSPYTQDDIYLGVYRDFEEAEAAKEIYINYISEHGDPYTNQAYMTVDLEQDVNIESFPDIVCDIDEESTDAVLLINHVDFMGQLYNQVMFLTDKQENLADIVKMLPIDELYKEMPRYWCYARLPIGKLHYKNHIQIL